MSLRPLRGTEADILGDGARDYPDEVLRGFDLVIASIHGRMKMDDVTKGVLPFMLAEFIIMFLMVLFPSLVTVPAKWFTG